MQSIILLYIKETESRPEDGAIQSRILDVSLVSGHRKHGNILTPINNTLEQVIAILHFVELDHKLEYKLAQSHLYIFHAIYLNATKD